MINERKLKPLRYYPKTIKFHTLKKRISFSKAFIEHYNLQGKKFDFFIEPNQKIVIKFSKNGARVMKPDPSGYYKFQAIRLFDYIPFSKDKKVEPQMYGDNFIVLFTRKSNE